MEHRLQQQILSTLQLNGLSVAPNTVPIVIDLTVDTDDEDGAVGGGGGSGSGGGGAHTYAAPPAYDENDYKLPLASAIGKLPTYEEVEREKAAREAQQQQRQNGGGGGSSGSTGSGGVTTTGVHCAPGLRVIAIHPTLNGAGGLLGGGSTAITISSSAAGGGRANDGSSTTINGGGGADSTDPENLLVTDDALLGTDLMFVASFLVAFMFNWMGFLLITCACHNIAARYGSLSGFGLSLAKWTMIVKSSSTMVTSEENAWLWWLIMSFGLLICVRSAVQYVNIKRSWRRMTVASAERMLIYDH